MPAQDDILITLTRAAQDERHIVRYFFVCFFNDLAQYDPNIVINKHGLPIWSLTPGGENIKTVHECADFNWWIRDSCEHWIIRVDGIPAGSILILADKNHLPDGVDFELLDFYITPKYRRQGVGKAAARLAFDLHHGAWQVFELAGNTPAQKFWHAVIGEYTNNDFQDLDDGTQQRFKN
jgi:predicted acetyltransferase